MKNKTNIRYPSYSQLIGINHSYSPRSSPPHVKRDIPPRLPTKKQRSQSLTPVQPGQTMTACSTLRNLNGKYCSADGVKLGNYSTLKRILLPTYFLIKLWMIFYLNF